MLGVGENEIGDELGAAAFELGGVEGEVSAVEAVVETVGEGEEGEGGEGGFVSDAAVHVESGGDGDVCA